MSEQAALRDLESELADLELNLATVRGELVAFERHYLEKVGQLYAQLDDLEARIADIEYRRKPRDDAARRKADEAKNRAWESAQAVDDIEPDMADRRFEPSESLGKVYREAARKLHPDLTTDEREKVRRKKAMAEVTCPVKRVHDAQSVSDFGIVVQLWLRLFADLRAFGSGSLIQQPQQLLILSLHGVVANCLLDYAAGSIGG